VTLNEQKLHHIYVTS